VALREEHERSLVCRQLFIDNDWSYGDLNNSTAQTRTSWMDRACGKKEALGYARGAALSFRRAFRLRSPSKRLSVVQLMTVTDSF